MKTFAAYLESIGEWKYSELNLPDLKEGECIVRVKSCGICSTDVIRSFETGFYFYPIVPGHEIFGEIERIEKNKKNLSVGDRVAVYPLIPKCKNTKESCCGHSENPNLCDNYNFLGFRTFGGYSKYLIAPISNLIKVPDNLPDNIATLVEPMSVAYHAIRQIDVKNTKKILIQGLGPIGVLIAHWCKFYNIDTVVGLDRNEIRFKSFLDTGYTEIINTSNLNELSINKNYNNFDIVFECSGSEDLINLGLSLCKKKGKMIILSNQFYDIKLTKKTINAIIRFEIGLIGAWSSQISPVNEWSKSIEVLVKIQDSLKNFISHEFNLNEAKKVFYEMRNKKFPFQKVLLKP